MTRIILICLLFASSAFAVETRRAEAGREAPAASLADLAWLAGQWNGEGLGGDSLVVYSAPFDGQIVGHFRQSKAGKIQFYEIVAIVEVAGSLEVRVKHFNADLVAWEDKADMEKFPLVAVEKDVWYFDGLTIRKNSADSMVETVLIETKDDKNYEAPFAYARTK